jgi:hypothetical protein
MKVLVSLLGFGSGWSLLAIGIVIGNYLTANPQAKCGNLIRLLHIPLSFLAFFIAPALYLESTYFKNVYIPWFIGGFVIRLVILFWKNKMNKSRY